MKFITALFVYKVLSVAESHIDRQLILHQLGLECSSMPDVSQMITAEDYYAFLENLARCENEGLSLPLRAGAAMRCEDYGAFGLAWKAASDLKGSVERAQRYSRVLTNVSTYSLEPCPEGGYIHLHRDGDRRLGMRLSNEATIASIATICAEAAGRSFQADKIFFKHSAPESTEFHEAFFGCPVIFGADRDALLVSESVLSAPNQVGDESIVRFFDNHLDSECAKYQDSPVLEVEMQRLISRALSEGVPTLSEIAQHLGWSARTLQRRLADEGFTYQALVDSTRRQLARHLLQNSEMSLIEIAFMTGFSEQSSFTRAFKRWSGQTPRSYRLNSQVG